MGDHRIRFTRFLRALFYTLLTQKIQPLFTLPETVPAVRLSLIWPMRCKGMASERGWKAPFRSWAQNTLGLPQAGIYLSPRDPLEPFQGIITSGAKKL